MIVKTDCETDGSYAAGGGDHSLLVTAAADAFLQPGSLPGPLVTASLGPVLHFMSRSSVTF